MNSSSGISSNVSFALSFEFDGVDGLAAWMSSGTKSSSQAHTLWFVKESLSMSLPCFWVLSAGIT